MIDSRNRCTRTALTANSLLVLIAVLGCNACAPIPVTQDTATIRVEALIHPPLLGLDFWSTALHIIEIDGTPAFLQEFHDAALTPGKHLVTVEVWKGPTGIFGVAPLLGKCRNQIEIDARAGSAYVVKFSRNENVETLDLINATSGIVLVHVPCLSTSQKQ